MKRFLATTALALGLTAALAPAASAAPPAGAGNGGKPAGVACQQAGISTLQSLGLLPAVAQGGIEVVGVGQVPFPTVLELHRTAACLRGRAARAARLRCVLAAGSQNQRQQNKP